MTGRTVDRAALWPRRQVLHLAELFIDRSMHESHLARGALRPLVVAGEVLFHVTVSAGYSKRAAVTAVHDP